MRNGSDKFSVETDRDSPYIVPGGAVVVEGKALKLGKLKIIDRPRQPEWGSYVFRPRRLGGPHGKQWQKVKSKYGFTCELLQDFVSLHFSHGQLLQFGQELARAKTTWSGGRFTDDKDSFASLCDSQRLVCLECRDNLGLIPGEFAHADIFHF